jgi:hypothetical protein
MQKYLENVFLWIYCMWVDLCKTNLKSTDQPKRSFTDIGKQKRLAKSVKITRW